jgi:precorrin-6B methylase 2
MGRVVCQAAIGYPFRRVIGVELASELNAIAHANVELNKQRLRCRDVQLITADALDYDPPSDITVAFFANPFQGRTMEVVVTKLLDAVDGPLRIVYFNPIEHEMLMGTGRLRVHRRLRGWRPTREWASPLSTIMYEAIPR